MDIKHRYKHLDRLLNERKQTTNQMENLISESSNNVEINNNTITQNQKEQTTNASRPKDKVCKRRIFIENIQFEVHENLLMKFFEKYGKIKKAKIIRDLNTNKSKGFGFIEFFDENDAVKMLKDANQAELVLKDRLMTIRQYFTKLKAPRIKKMYLSKDQDIEQNENEEKFHELNINDLPLDLLTNIFSQLCIRDLCIVEQVCKKWNNVAQIVWSTKKKLIVNDYNLFENYEMKTNSEYGFKLKPKFNANCLKKILFKSSGTSLKHLDLSAYSTYFGPLCLSFIVEHCPNITHLNISKLNVSNQSFKNIRGLSKLQELNLAYCSQISDMSLSKIMQNCKNLESIDMTFCHLITGKFFAKSSKNLKSIKIDQCENISDDNLVNLFSANKNLTNISMKRSKSYATSTILCLLNNLKSLKILNIAEHGFDSFTNEDLQRINFEALHNLTSLDISCSKTSNELVGKLLRTSKSLKILNLSYCSKINDNLFIGLSINSPLEELNLSFAQQITDVTLESLSQLTNSLKSLKLKGCNKLTNEGIMKLMTQLPNLNFLDVRSNSNVNNVLLESAINLENRIIKILCNDTSINTIEFEFKYPEVNKKQLERIYYEFKFKNLTFESNLSKKIQADDDPEIWKKGIYIGSPFSSNNSSDSWMMHADDSNDDYEQDDDLEFLDENQEMFDELNQY